jgi:hypothetical protein
MNPRRAVAIGAAAAPPKAAARGSVATQGSAVALTVTVPLHRDRKRRVELAVTPPAPRPAPVHRPAKLACLLAFAHHVARTIDRGGYPDYAAVAADLGLTRARITQVMNLLWLAPDLQERVLALEAIDGREPLAERALRPVLGLPLWSDQRARWTSLGLDAIA